MKSGVKAVLRLQLYDNENLVQQSDYYVSTSGLTYNIVSNNSQ